MYVEILALLGEVSQQQKGYIFEHIWCKVGISQGVKINIMFENAFKNIDQILHTDSGSATELDYVEQTSWILFLKYFDKFLTF